MASEDGDKKGKAFGKSSLVKASADLEGDKCDGENKLIASAAVTIQNMSEKKVFPHMIVNVDEGTSDGSCQYTGRDSLELNSPQPQEQDFPDPSIWSEEIHRSFASAVYEIGLENASPLSILENMKNECGTVTKERVKSHLQKYRITRDKARDEFRRGFDKWMKRTVTLIKEDYDGKILSSATLRDLVDVHNLGGGDLAAFLSLSSMLDESNNEDDPDPDPHLEEYSNNVLGLLDLGGHVSFPKLTEEEKESPLGQMLMYIMGCFIMLRDRIHEHRERKREKELEDIDPVPLVHLNGDQMFLQSMPPMSSFAQMIMPHATTPESPYSGSPQMWYFPGPYGQGLGGYPHRNAPPPPPPPPPLAAMSPNMAYPRRPMIEQEPAAKRMRTVPPTTSASPYWPMVRYPPRYNGPPTQYHGPPGYYPPCT